MILRAFALAGGFVGAVSTSQLPEYSQQYLQRLGGAKDALEQVIADFDASAAAVGLNRAEALDQMQGSAFMDRRRADMAATFVRYEKLTEAQVALTGQGAFMRVYLLPRVTDPQIAQATFRSFEPAMPLTFTGLLFTIAGFVLGAALIGGVLGFLGLPFRRSRRVGAWPDQQAAP